MVWEWNHLTQRHFFFMVYGLYIAGRAVSLVLMDRNMNFPICNFKCLLSGSPLYLFLKLYQPNSPTPSPWFVFYSVFKLPVFLCEEQIWMQIQHNFMLSLLPAFLYGNAEGKGRRTWFVSECSTSGLSLLNIFFFTVSQNACLWS